MCLNKCGVFLTKIDMKTLDDCTEFTVCMEDCMHGRMDANGYQGC